MKKSLVIVSVCLVLLMSLSIISAGWFTVNILKVNDGGEINVYDTGKEEKFDFNGETYRIHDVKIEGDVVSFSAKNEDTNAKAFFTFGDPSVMGSQTEGFNIDIELLKIDSPGFLKLLFSSAKHRARLRVSEAVDELSSEDEETLKGFFNYGVDHKLDLDLANPNQNCDVCREYTSESDKEYNLYTTKNVGSNWICYSELSSHRPQEGGMRPGLQDYVAWTEVKFIGAGLPGELSGEFESEIQGKTNNAKCVYVASHPITNKPEFVLLSYRKFSLLLKEGKIIKEKSEDEFNTFKVKYGRRLNINGETNYYKLT
jgi:hypothetical protein